MTIPNVVPRMEYYARERALHYINTHTEDINLIRELMPNATRIEIIQLLRTDSNLCLSECSNIYHLLAGTYR